MDLFTGSSLRRLDSNCQSFKVIAQAKATTAKAMRYAGKQSPVKRLSTRDYDSNA